MATKKDVLFLVLEVFKKRKRSFIKKKMSICIKFYKLCEKQPFLNLYKTVRCPVVSSLFRYFFLDFQPQKITFILKIYEKQKIRGGIMNIFKNLRYFTFLKRKMLDLLYFVCLINVLNFYAKQIYLDVI